MPMVILESSMLRRNRRYGRQRNHDQDQDQEEPIHEIDPIPSIVNSTRSKPTISCLLSSTFSPSVSSNEHPTSQKRNFKTGKFRGLGCTASSEVSVPEVIRTSANWEAKKVKKKKNKKGKKNQETEVLIGATNGGPSNVNGIIINNNNNSSNNNPSASLSFSSSCVAVPDVWCGPGNGLTTDAASVDYVVSRRPSSGRGKVDGEIMAHRERPSCSIRRMVASEDDPFVDYDSAIETPHTQLDAFGSRHHRDSLNQNNYPQGIAEIMMLQSRLLLGGRIDGLDRYRDWRLDVDNMSYEELLELGDKIGYVSTGLKEDEIDRCLNKGIPSLKESFSWILVERERKCSICQEDLEGDEEIGKLKCGHSYHIQCIKQWLHHKNTCPVCKSVAKN